jgi:hypothetical protein
MLTPSSGHEGDAVVISGAFLGSANKINFGSVSGVVIDPKGGEVTTQVPAGLPLGMVEVTVQTNGGMSNSISFTVIPPAPQVTSINPVEGGAGISIAITGKFFTTAKEVDFGTTKVTTLDSKSETAVAVKVPDGLPLGATDVTIISDGGTSNKISFTVVAKPTITNFAPPAGPAGTHVIITGTSLDGASKVVFGTVDGAFTPMSATQLDAVVPASATSGKVKVVTPGGEALSATDFIVKGAPVIASFSPASGIAGTEVTITGQNFAAPGAAVKFGATLATTITVNSDTEIKATVPAGAVTGKISVTTIAGTGTSATDFIVPITPIVVSFTPGSGPVGTMVAIAGFNFTNASSVKFNVTESGVGNFTVNSATQITAKVPAGATNGVVTVTTPLGMGSSSASFSIQDLPIVASFTPTSGAIGDNVTITGTNFINVSSVKFNTTEVSAANFTVNSSTQITAKVPAGAGNGVITVTTPAGGGSSSTSFTIIGAPTVTSFTPTSGIIGATVTITGTGFTGATSVKFNTTEVGAANFTVNSATQITATVPTSASSGVITVTTPAGAGSSSALFTIIGAPTVTSFTPTSGAVGINVTITGTNLTGASSVKFNATEVGAGNFTVNSSTQIIAKVPVGATNGIITITTPAGSGSSATSFTVIPPPTVTAFTPASGAVAQSVVITGTSFLSVTAVKFNGVSAITYTVNNETQITVTIPAGATTGKISVETAAGAGMSAANFTVAAAPTVASFTPTSSVVGATLTITGTNFVNVSSVKFNGTEVGLANIAVTSTTQLTAKVPDGATSGTISVTTPSGTGTSAGSFTVIPPPTITSFTPTSGPTGTSVVITGTAFTGASSVKFNNTTATYTVNSATQITATVPVSATSGVISVTTPGGSVNSSGSFTVILPPLISSISPTTAVTGTTLTITGSSLASATSVDFSATVVTTLISNTDSQITVIIPGSLSAGAVNVSVVTAAGTSNTKTLTIVPAPVITDLKPNVSYKGFPIMIRGSNLAGTISAKIGSTDATIMTKYDATVIVTIPGTMSNGTYSVTVSNEGGPSNGVTLNIVDAPASVGSPPTGTYVSPPPANYVNVISNQWTNTKDNSVAFLLGLGSASQCQIINPSYEFGTSATDQYVCGSYTFTKDGTGKVTANYIELTLGYGHPATNLETFYGEWSATAVVPCVHKLVVISSKDGHVLIATVQTGDPASGTCTP